MKRRSVAAAATSGALATLALVSVARTATDIEVDARAGDIISEIATVVGEFRLTNLPAELQIKADAMSFDYASGVLAYNGRVRVSHADVRLRSDRLEFGFAPGTVQSLRSVEAFGNVAVVHGAETARGSRASFDPESATIRLTGRARLGSGPNTLSGESVVVYLDERRATVEGGDKPVRAVIDPGAVEDLEYEGALD